MLYHYGIIQDIFAALRNLCVLPIHPSLLPQSLATTNLLTVSITLSCLERYMVGTLQTVVFSEWLPSLGVMHKSECLTNPLVTPAAGTSSVRETPV